MKEVAYIARYGEYHPFKNTFTKCEDAEKIISLAPCEHGTEQVIYLP